MAKYRWNEFRRDGYEFCKKRHGGSNYLLYICHLPGRGRDCMWSIRAGGREVASGICEDIAAAAARAEHYYERWVKRDCPDEWLVYG